MGNARIVAKFGGTSMGTAEAMCRSAQVAKDRGAVLVVVSATSGTTNTLEQLMELAEQGAWDKCHTILGELRQRHLSIAEELGAEQETWKQLEAVLSEARTITHGMCLLKEVSSRAKDGLYSVGERLSSWLFTQAYLKQTGQAISWFDVREVMRTDSSYGRARPQFDEIRDLAQAQLVPLLTNGPIVTQGFLGATENGHTTTLGRGGSDYSASILGEAIGAKEVQIWTDVAGIATTDPRICPAAQPISEITFKEAAELAVFGAKVLHPTTLTPAMRSGMDVFVGSSFQAEAPGTWIRRQTEQTPLVRALALKRKQCLLTLSTPKMLHTHGFLYEVFKIFNQYEVSVDSITTSEISVALTIDDATRLNKNLIESLSELCDVKVEENLGLVSLIGNNVNFTPGLAKKVFATLEDVNVRMICQGASKHNFCFLVAEPQAETALKRLHSHFLE